MKIFTRILLLILVSTVGTKAATCTAIASTNFTLASTWSCGHVPTGTEGITIPSGFTVTITSNIDLTTTNSNTYMSISGNLFFSGNASRLDLPSTATVTINSGGSITSDQNNNSQKFKIGNNTIWSSNSGTVTGPTTATGSSSPLPIELIDFSGEVLANNTINLKWQTATEKINDYFDIERSIDGIEFVKINKTKSKSIDGNSLQKLSYESNDAAPINGINYYRLKQTDLTTEFHYSKTIAITLNKEEKVSFVIYPNPNNGEFYVNINGIENNHQIEVLIYDNKQTLIYSSKTDIESIKSKQFNFKLQETLKIGLYNVLFDMEGVKYKCSLVIQ